MDHNYPDKRIVLMMGHLNTHAPTLLYETFELAETRSIAERLGIHYTPKHGRWLNMAEVKISAMVGPYLNRRLPDRESVWMDWRFTTADARIKPKSLIPVSAKMMAC